MMYDRAGKQLTKESKDWEELSAGEYNGEDQERNGENWNDVGRSSRTGSEGSSPT